jgi:gliding motility-associated-like protein
MNRPVKKNLLLIPFFVLFLGNLCSQTYQIDTINAQTISTCKGTVVSSHPGFFVGDTGGYNDNENDTVTFCSSTGGPLRANFYFVSLENGFDFLYVYDGPSVASPLIATLTGDVLYPGVFTSTGSCLTFRFASDGGTTWGGFNFMLGCTPVPCNSNPLATDSCSVAPVICNLNNYCGTTSGWYTRDNGTIEGAIYGGSDVFSCGSIQNNSWVAFIASSTTATFNITSSCTNTLGGIQAIVLSSPDCANFTSVSNCITQGLPGTDVLNATGLVAGQKYYIMVDGVNGNDCDYTIQAQNGAEIATLSASVNPVCPNTNDTITATAPGTGLTYNWSPVPASGQGTATAVYNVSGATTYSCTITGACGAAETPTISVTTLAATVVSINDTAVCAGDPAILTASGADTYTWSAGITPTGVATASVTPSATATYTVVGTTTATGCNDSAQFTVTVNNLPVLTVPDDTVCLGATATLVASGAVSYSWSTGSTNDTITYVPAAAGTTTFTVTGTTSNCSSDTVVSVIANPVPALGTPMITHSMCNLANGSIASAVSGGTGPFTYSWTTVPGGASAGTSATLTNVAAGQYQLGITDVNSCVASGGPYTVTDSASVTAQFTSSATSGTSPLTVSFTNTTAGTNTWSWNFGNGQVSALQTPPAQVFSGDGTYTVTLIADNGTCSDTALALITVTSKSMVDTIPNVFSPNGDGVNDVFQFKAANTVIERFEVYNRWGVKVYEAPDIPGLSTIVWDGHTTSGLPCSEGTYFYIFKGTGTDSTAFEYAGFLTLIR